MSRRDSPAQTGGASVLLATVLWFVTAFAAAAPGSLLYSNAESRLPHMAGAALVFAGVIALFLGVTSVRVSSRSLLPATTAVVLLCVAAPIMLQVDGRVSPGGGVMFGGAAGALAVLAGALMLGAKWRAARPEA